MHKIDTKSFSTNMMYRGRKSKSYKYLNWQEHMMCILPDHTIPEGKLKLEVEVGLSNMGADLDNFAGKAFIDTLSNKHGFNDNRIYQILMTKVKVKKGAEYIKYNIKGYE